MQELIIIGAGGLGREVLWLAREINRREPSFLLIGFLDDSETLWGTDVDGVPVLGGTNLAPGFLSNPLVRFVIAIGEPAVRKDLASWLAPLGAQYATLIDPQVRGDWERVQIGPGSIICAGTIFTTNIILGAHVIVNPSVNVGHDTVIGDYVTLAPDCTVSGSTKLGEGVYLGTSCVIRDEVEIGAWTIVGMGAVVTKSIRTGVVVAGVPARVTRENSSRRVW